MQFHLSFWLNIHITFFFNYTSNYRPFIRYRYRVKMPFPTSHKKTVYKLLKVIAKCTILKVSSHTVLVLLHHLLFLLARDNLFNSWRSLNTWSSSASLQSAALVFLNLPCSSSLLSRRSSSFFYPLFYCFLSILLFSILMTLTNHCKLFFFNGFFHLFNLEPVPEGFITSSLTYCNFSSQKYHLPWLQSVQICLSPRSYLHHIFQNWFIVSLYTSYK